jgi:hypothetical protein
MSSALTNSLLLLNEIRDQLNASKSYNSNKKASPHKQPPTYEKNREFTTSKNTEQMDAGYTVTTASSIQEEEPLRVELSRKAYNVINTPHTPPISQKIRIEDAAQVKETSFADGLNTLSSNVNGEASPYKRKILGRDPGVDVAVEKIAQRSQEMANNLKKMLNKEIEQFARECDALKDKITGILTARTSRTNVSESNLQMRSTRRNLSPDGKENLSEATMNQITRKIDKLATEFEDKKNKSLKNTSIFDRLGPSPGKSIRGLESSGYETPSLSGPASKLNFE